jgi:hypothetical protein
MKLNQISRTTKAREALSHVRFDGAVIRPRKARLAMIKGPRGYIQGYNGIAVADSMKGVKTSGSVRVRQ